MWEMNHEDGAEHDHNETCCSNPNQDAAQHCQRSGTLRQSHKVPEENRHVMARSKPSRSESSERPEKNSAVVIKERHSARDTKDQERSVDLSRLRFIPQAK